MIKYSIIIPHKNSIETLKRCLHSIPERNDIEVIVVDDNSDTDKVDFKFPISSNTQLIFTKEGKGAGYARNIGLSKASGKWILFADADDFFEPDFDKIIDENYFSKADIIYFKTRSVLNSTLQITKSRVNYIHLNNEEKLRFTHIPWGKMIKRDLILLHKVKFDETMVANDAFFSVYYGINAKVVNFIDKCIYVSTIGENSLFFKKSIEKEIIRLSVSKKINNYLKRNHLNKKRICIFQCLEKIKKLSKEEYNKELINFLKEEDLFSILLDFIKYLKTKL